MTSVAYCRERIAILATTVIRARSASLVAVGLRRPPPLEPRQATRIHGVDDHASVRPTGGTYRPRTAPIGAYRWVIWSTTSLAVSAQAVVPPLPYCLTASPTFHRLGIGVSLGRS